MARELIGNRVHIKKHFWNRAVAIFKSIFLIKSTRGDYQMKLSKSPPNFEILDGWDPKVQIPAKHQSSVKIREVDV